MAFWHRRFIWILGCRKDQCWDQFCFFFILQILLHWCRVLVFQRMSLLMTCRYIFFFCWVPGHIGIPGNEQVDDLAKLPVNLDSSEEPMFFKDLKPSINEHLTNIWQNRWSQSSPNKFLEIVPDLKGWKVPLLQQTRKDEVIMCRSRLGHARLTHSYLFRNEDPPECIYCACRLTVKHILIECPDYELSRQKYFNCNTLPELFEKTPEANIMTYLKEIGLYSRF